MVNCPSCGSNDTESLGVNKCNDCSTIFFGESVSEISIEIRDFMKKLCDLSLCSEVYFTLLEAGGAQRFTDIRKHMKISTSTLSRNLMKLLRNGFVRMVGKKYQAMRPIWLQERE